MAKGLLDLLLDSIFDEEWLGKHGEKLTERELNLVKLFGRSGKVLRNIYIPKGNGETSEIDVLFITQKGLFVIESKNYSGWIFGSEHDTYWTAMLPNKTKNRFYNPIKQNRTHIKWLGQYLTSEFGAIPFFSFVVFSERCELKRVTIETPEIRVIKRDRIYANVRDVWNENNDILDESQMNQIYECLEKLTHMDQAVKQAHINSIKNRYDKKYIENKKQEQELVYNMVNELDLDRNDKDKIEYKNQNMICPRCGGNLILRVAKRGKYAGKSFYGCSNFPKCRYSINVLNDNIETNLIHNE